MRCTRFRLGTRLALLATLLAIGGCATGARPDAMTVGTTSETTVTAASPLHDAIAIRNVTGGGQTNPAWMSNVSADSFRTALEQSLAAHAMLASGPGRYTLIVDLLSIERPLFAWDMTVSATIRYTIAPAGGETIKLDETIVTPATVKFGDAPFGPERRRLAVEAAIRANIDAFIARLIKAAQPGQPLAS